LKPVAFIPAAPDVLQHVAQSEAELPGLYNFDRLINGVASVVGRMVDRFMPVLDRASTEAAFYATVSTAGHEFVSLDYVRSHSYLGSRLVTRGLDRFRCCARK
jgi:hypothetical protein